MKKDSKNNLLVVVSKGTLDMAYPPFMLATTAASLGMKASLYFTFWGMDIIKKKTAKNLKIDTMGNPSLPLTMVGLMPSLILGVVLGAALGALSTVLGVVTDMLTGVALGAVMGIILGIVVGVVPTLMTSMVTSMMKGKMQKIKMPSIPEMVAMAKGMGVKLYACSPTMQLQGITKEDLIPEVDDIIGAATYLEMASEEGTITLFV